MWENPGPGARPAEEWVHAWVEALAEEVLALFADPDAAGSFPGSPSRAAVSRDRSAPIATPSAGRYRRALSGQSHVAQPRLRLR
ncbi:MAG: hypothetical protein EBU81_10445 [Proteobacteria bacterium]|nr:hypothetical protein [Pseudomonadota bacterium]